MAHGRRDAADRRRHRGAAVGRRRTADHSFRSRAGTAAARLNIVADQEARQGGRPTTTRLADDRRRLQGGGAGRRPLIVERQTQSGGAAARSKKDKAGLRSGAATSGRRAAIDCRGSRGETATRHARRGHRCRRNGWRRATSGRTGWSSSTCLRRAGRGGRRRTTDPQARRGRAAARHTGSGHRCRRGGRRRPSSGQGFSTGSRCPCRGGRRGCRSTTGS